MPHIVVIGTCDTKLEELLYLRSQILENAGEGCEVTLVDAGRSPAKHEAITITQDTLTSKYAPKDEKPKDVASLPRGEVINYMIACASDWLSEAYRNGLDDPKCAIHGIITAGGTGNTSLASGVMRAVLPIGFPKLIVSTNASADVSHVVGETDITMMPSIVDIAGNNELLQRILANAAGAIVGMSTAYEQSLASKPTGNEATKKKRVGLSMFGVTTPACDKIRHYLETNYPIECFVFHQTGAGGKAMERLIDEGGLDAVCDLTTTELCDHQCGGVMDSGPHRLEAALKAGIPNIISVGALDMCNFGPKGTVPEKYQHRKLFEHNPTVTLMRVNPEESKAIGNFIVEKIKSYAKDKNNVLVALPLGGISIIATPDAPFYDAEADEGLFAAIRDGLEDSDVNVWEDKRAINDEEFAVDVAKRLIDLMHL